MKILESMDGKKTYIVAALTIIYAIIGFYLGQLDSQSAIQLILAGLGAIGFRSALAK